MTSCEFIATNSAHLIRLEVSDSRAVGTDSIQLEIIEQSTTASIQTLNNGDQTTADQLIAFEGLVEDPEDLESELLVRWVSSIDGDLNLSQLPNDQGVVNGYTTLSIGQHAIELHVEDSLGKTDMDSVIITVNEANTAPQCSLFSPPNNSASVLGESIIFEGLATDQETNAVDLNITWQSSIDGHLGNSIPATMATFCLSGTHTVIHTIEMRVLIQGDCVKPNSFIRQTPTVTIHQPLDGTTIAAATTSFFSDSK